MTDEEKFNELVNGIEINPEKVAQEEITEIFNADQKRTGIIGLLQFIRIATRVIIEHTEKENGEEAGKIIANSILETVWSCMSLLNETITRQDFQDAMDTLMQIDSIMESAVSNE